MCLDLYGPRSFRRSDLTLLTDSCINEKLRVAQAHLLPQDQKCAYGDGNLNASYTEDDVLENYCDISLEDYLSDAHTR